MNRIFCKNKKTRNTLAKCSTGFQPVIKTPGNALQRSHNSGNPLLNLIFSILLHTAKVLQKLKFGDAQKEDFSKQWILLPTYYSEEP